MAGNFRSESWSRKYNRCLILSKVPCLMTINSCCAVPIKKMVFLLSFCKHNRPGYKPQSRGYTDDYLLVTVEIVNKLAAMHDTEDYQIMSALLSQWLDSGRCVRPSICREMCNLLKLLRFFQTFGSRVRRWLPQCLLPQCWLYRQRFSKFLDD